MRSLLAMERIALNFLQRLSGIATLTARFVAAVAGTRAAIYDTRKTTPGWRALEKYAVRCGGGCQPPFRPVRRRLDQGQSPGLAAGRRRPGGPDPIAVAIAARARQHARRHDGRDRGRLTRTTRHRPAIARPDIILVDNLGPELLAEAVRRRDRSALGSARSVRRRESGHRPGTGRNGRRSHQRRCARRTRLRRSISRSTSSQGPMPHRSVTSSRRKNRRW